MSRILFFLWFLMVVISTSAQKFDLKEKKNKLPDGTYNGYELTLSGDEESIKEKWNEQLKEIGKVKKKRGHLEISEAQFGDQVDLTLGTTVRLRADSSVSIWLGAKIKKPRNDIMRDVEDYLSSFGQEYYRSLLREDVQLTEKEAVALSKSHQKLMNENKNLSFELEEALKEQERIKNSLEKISLEIQVIQQKIENNNTEAGNILIKLDNTNQKLDQKKSSLKKVN